MFGTLDNPKATTFIKQWIYWPPFISDSMIAVSFKQANNMWVYKDQMSMFQV